MAAHIDPNRAVERANSALDAARGIGYHLPAAGGFMMGMFLAKKILDRHLLLSANCR
jgi:hypothetical protein